VSINTQVLLKPAQQASSGVIRVANIPRGAGERSQKSARLLKCEYKKNEFKKYREIEKLRGLKS
jgi:hypothetical protein